FGHDLVAEAHTDHPAVLRRADEGLERLDPRVWIIDPRRGSGDQISVMSRGVARHLAGRDVESLELEFGAEHRREHVGIVAELLFKVAGRVARLKDCKLHGACLATSWPFGQCSN